MRSTPPILILSVAIALSATATHAAQSVTLTAGPTEGVAPFEADLRVIAQGVDDDSILQCSLLFGDVRDGEPAAVRFVMQAPWPAEAVFPHTYRYSGTFAPDLTCVGAGTTGDSAELVVTPRAGNRPPQLDLAVSPATGPATVTRTLTVRQIADPDGDTLDCFIDFDVNLDFNFNGDETVYAFGVAPPYNDVQFQFDWDVARSFSPNVFCVDGRGGSIASAETVTISPVTGNRSPTVLLDRQFPANSEPGISRRFRVRMDDPDNDTLRCQFRPTWDSEREWFTAAPPYTSRNFNRTFKTFGSHLQAYALCVDPEGALGSINRGFDVEVFPSGNGFPVVLDAVATPDSGMLPEGLEAEFTITAFDPDGDDLGCRIDFGDGEGATTVQIPAAQQGTPVAANHSYDSRGSKGARIVCDDGSLANDGEHEWVDVYQDGKRFPTVAVTADPDSGGGLLPVTLTLEFDEPDGQMLDCNFSYGTPYPGGGVLPADFDFQVGPPFDPIELDTTIYRGTQRTTLSCVDPTGRRHDAEQWIRITPFNQAPTIETFVPHRSSSILDTLFAIFPIRVTDPNLDQSIDCELDFGDGVVWPFIRFEFPNYGTVNVSHLYQARRTPYEAVLSCDDNEGETVEASQMLEVGVAANRPPAIDMELLPPFGIAPFNTVLRFTIEDVNAPEGDFASCVVDLGDGSAPIAVSPATEFQIPHTYVFATVYRPTISCTDTFGVTTTVTKPLFASLPGDARTIPPVEIERR